MWTLVLVLFESVAIIIGPIIRIIIVVIVIVIGDPAIFLIREIRIDMCETLLQFGEQVPRTRLQCQIDRPQLGIPNTHLESFDVLL